MASVGSDELDDSLDDGYIAGSTDDSKQNKPSDSENAKDEDVSKGATRFSEGNAPAGESKDAQGDGGVEAAESAEPRSIEPAVHSNETKIMQSSVKAPDGGALAAVSPRIPSDETNAAASELAPQSSQGHAATKPPTTAQVAPGSAVTSETQPQSKPAGTAADAEEDLEEQLLARTQELVAARQDNVGLQEQLQAMRQQLQQQAAAARPPAPSEEGKLRAEVDEARSAALAALPLGASEEGAGLADLVRQVARHGAAASAKDSDALREELRAARGENQRLQGELQEAGGALEEAQAELEELRASDQTALAQHSSSQLRSLRQRHKRLKQDLAGSEDKVDALTEHIEKLMIHLKHEAAAKARAMDAARKAEREAGRLRERGQGLAHSNLERERVILELKEGAKILEDQLRLMDQKYVELRGKLDWTRAHAKKEVARAEKQVDHVRRQWIQVQAVVPRKLRQQITDPPPPLRETLAKKGKGRGKKGRRRAGAGGGAAGGGGGASTGSGAGTGGFGSSIGSSGKRSEGGGGALAPSPMQGSGGRASGFGGRQSAGRHDESVDYSQAMSMLDSAPESRPTSSRGGARRR